MTISNKLSDAKFHKLSSLLWIFKHSQIIYIMLLISAHKFGVITMCAYEAAAN